jgi:integrase
VTEKGDKTRHVPFTEPTAQALRAWLEVALFVSLARGGSGALTRGGVAQMLQRRGKQAGVKGFHNAHSFRHFFAREFLQ